MLKKHLNLKKREEALSDQFCSAHGMQIGNSQRGIGQSGRLLRGVVQRKRKKLSHGAVNERCM